MHLGNSLPRSKDESCDVYKSWHLHLWYDASKQFVRSCSTEIFVTERGRGDGKRAPRGNIYNQHYPGGPHALTSVRDGQAQSTWPQLKRRRGKMKDTEKVQTRGQSPKKSNISCVDTVQLSSCLLYTGDTLAYIFHTLIYITRKITSACIFKCKTDPCEFSPRAARHSTIATHSTVTFTVTISNTKNSNTQSNV